MLDDASRLFSADEFAGRAFSGRFRWFLAGFLFAMLSSPSNVLLARGDGPEILAAEALDRFNEGLADKSVPMLEEALSDFDLVYEKVGAKTVKKFHRAYGKLFKLEPRQEIREDGSDPREELLLAYQLALGTVFDKEGGDVIIVSGLKLGHIKRWPDAEALFVDALGFRADPKSLKVLASYLKSEKAPVVRASAHGLGLFSESDVDVRRSAVKPLVEALMACSKAAEKEAKKGRKEEAQEHFIAVEGTFFDALLKLTRKRFDSANEYEVWFKKNGANDTW
jgi:hypothetical protein